MTMSLLTSSQTHTLYPNSISANSISASLTDKVTSRNVTLITHIPSLKPVSKTPYHTIKAKSSQNGNSSVVVTEEKVTIKNSNSKNDENCEDVKASLNDVKKFSDGKWINGTWDLQQFKNNVNGTTNWDAVIDAEAKRRKWLQTYPESTSNAEPIIFDTSIVPWWAWIKRFHLPEAELLNGRAAMVGFFMSYFVDSLTGVGLVNQMGNFVCKTLLFVSILGVLFIRKNEDIENLKKLLDESTFYDKQWQATWQKETKKE